MLQPSAVRANRLAGRNAHAQLFNILDISVAEGGEIHVSVCKTPSGVDGAFFEFEATATVGSLADAIAARFDIGGSGGLVGLIYGLDVLGPLDAAQPLAAFRERPQR